MKDFRTRLEAGVIVGDGGWGTQLAEHGLPAGTPPELWTLEHPEVISAIASAYADAGAEVITTNTFGASPMRLTQHHLSDSFVEINRRGVEIVKNAIGDRAFVSASIGPTGRLLTPLGDAEPADAARGFEEQARVLVGAGADVICVETMTDIEEAVLAVRAIRSASSAIPVMATMTFEMTPRGPFTVMGVPVGQAVTRLKEAGADIVGSNCGAGLDEMLGVADAFLGATTLPIAIQPNAGLPVMSSGKLVYPETPQRFADLLAPLAARGVRFLGGCCGTTPAHIGALREAISRL